MVFFKNKDVDLKKEIYQVKAQRDSEIEKNKKLQSKNTKLNVELNQIRKEYNELSVFYAELETYKITTENSINKKVTSSIKFIRVIGVIFVLLSWIAIYWLYQQRDIINIGYWSMYLFTQFSGLYLLGFGRKVNINSYQYLGKYMIVIFTILLIVMMLGLFGFIDLIPNKNLISLIVINSLGVPLLIKIEQLVLKKY